MVSNVSTNSLQELQADVLRNNQLLVQLQQFINSLDQTLFELHNIITTGFNQGSQLDTDSTDIANPIQDFSVTGASGILPSD